MAYGDAFALPPERRIPWWGLVGASVVTAAFAALCFGPSWPDRLVSALPTMLFSGALVAAAVVLRAEPGQVPSSRALVAAALLWPTGWAMYWPNGPGALVSLFGWPIAVVLLAWGVSRYPDPFEVGLSQVGLLAALSVWLVVGELAIVVTSRPEWITSQPGQWWFTIHADRGVSDVLTVLVPGVEGLLVIPILVQWYRRVRRMPDRTRRLLRPLVVAGVVAALTSAFCPVAELLGFSDFVIQTIFGLQGLLLVGVPLALAYAVVSRRSVSARVAGLVDQLWRDPRPENVERAFRSVLGPDLRVGYWSPEHHDYLDSTGRPFARPDLPADPRTGDHPRAWPDDRLVRPVRTTDGEPLALLVADPELAHYPDLVDAAVSAGALALGNARLQVDARAQLAEVQGSRARLVEAGLAERRGLEQALQNGALGRIRAVSERLEKLEQAPGGVPEALAPVLAQAREQLARATHELDEIGQGLHPAELTDQGLDRTVRRMASEQPLRVEVSLPPQRMPIEVEVAAYYVVSEAMTNAVRHSGASLVRVWGARTGDTFRVSVSDDGRGGADPAAGSGLTGLRERVAMAGGGLSIVSPPGGGTTLRAEIPCG